MHYEYSDKISDMKPSIIREILKQMSDPSLISFAGGNPDARSFPSQAISRISAQLLEDDPVGMLQYSVTEGVPSVRAAIAKFACRKYKLIMPEDELIITSGSQQILDFTARVLCNEGDTVAVEEPAFLGAYNAFRAAGAVLRGVPPGADGVDIERLEAAFKARPTPRFFYCIPNFQNPTGCTMSLAKRRAVYALSVKYNVPILEDDPYGELRTSGTQLPPIKSLDTQGNVIYAGSFSKILSPAMRLAYCIAPREMAAKLIIAKQVSDVHTNVWAQRVCEAVLNTTDMDKHIGEVQALYRAKLCLMADELAAKCPQLQFTQPCGGMFIWAKLQGASDAQPLVSDCLAQRLALIPGSAFMVNDALPAPTVRINFSAPSAENIVKGVDILQKALLAL